MTDLAQAVRLYASWYAAYKELHAWQLSLDNFVEQAGIDPLPLRRIVSRHAGASPDEWPELYRRILTDINGGPGQ